MVQVSGQILGISSCLWSSAKPLWHPEPSLCSSKEAWWRGKLYSRKFCHCTAYVTPTSVARYSKESCWLPVAVQCYGGDWAECWPGWFAWIDLLNSGSNSSLESKHEIETFLDTNFWKNSLRQYMLSTSILQLVQSYMYGVTFNSPGFFFKTTFRNLLLI